jgi:hypothetical protein
MKNQRDLILSNREKRRKDMQQNVHFDATKINNDKNDRRSPAAG